MSRALANPSIRDPIECFCQHTGFAPAAGAPAARLREMALHVQAATEEPVPCEVTLAEAKRCAALIIAATGG